MDQNIAQMQAELEEAGYETRLLQTPHGQAVTFEYRMENGSHTGEIVRIGISGPEGPYPEYPPHWVHISPPIGDGKSAHAQYQVEGQNWLPLSRPPKDFWDQRKERNMAVYISDHLRRLWKDV